MKKILVLLLFFMTLGAAQAFGAEKPMIQEGKKTLYERAVSHPGAQLYSDEKGSSVVGKPLTFTSYYVYDKKDGMVKVGVSSTKSDGWLKEEDLTYWPQAMTLTFTQPGARKPVLFFKTHDDLVNLCAADNIGKTVEKYLKEVASGKALPENSPVLASEPLPDKGSVSEDNFYLLPIMKMDDQYSDAGTKLIEVACIDPGDPEAAKKAENEKAKKTGGKTAGGKNNNGMHTGLVFLIDTTISMGPYIEQTKEIIRKIYDKLQSSPAKDNVSIAVVAFRSNVEKAPKTEYNTKIISNFTSVKDRVALEKLLDNAEECKASTHAFDEDSLAGVAEAVEHLNWDGIDSKAMLLITDAGPLGANDPTSKTGMSPEAMAGLLKHNNIFLTVAHIKAPSGAKDHAYAEKSYRDLSLLDSGRSSYIDIKAPDPATGARNFEKVGSAIAGKYQQIVEMSLQDKLVEQPESADIDASLSPEEKAAKMAEAIGYAMQLQFAGKKNATSAPQVVNAWIPDVDLTALEKNPNGAPLPAVEPCVLMTKVQLSRLRDRLQDIFNIAEQAFLQDKDNYNFYDQLLSAAAQMSNDPTQFNKKPEVDLVEIGMLDEALANLPYKSHVMNLGKDTWINMSTGEQQAFLSRIKGLIELYKKYDNDDAHWESFGSSEPNEWVYRVPLSKLP